jgi:hypothetical protein
MPLTGRLAPGVCWSWLYLGDTAPDLNGGCRALHRPCVAIPPRRHGLQDAALASTADYPVRGLFGCGTTRKGSRRLRAIGVPICTSRPTRRR